MATCDVIMLCVTVFIIGMIVGILLIVTADDDYEEVMDYMYKCGYEHGKEEENKRVMACIEKLGGNLQ